MTDQNLTEGMPAAETARRLGGEWRVLALVAAVLAVVEVAFSVAGDRLSKDVAHWQSLPRLSRSFAELDAPATRIMFLGNSLTRYGVDEPTFTAALSDARGPGVITLKIVPDNSALAEWYHVYRTHFSRTKHLPNVLVVGFEGGHLRDAPPRHLDRIARYSAAVTDLPDLWGGDVRNAEEAGLFLSSSFSAAFGNRDRVQRRLLDAIVPGYREGMDRVNAALRQSSQETGTTSVAYRRLERFLGLAKQDGIRTVLVAMPVPNRYRIDRELESLAAASGATLLDLRDVHGLTPGMFFDGLHMDAEAARLYSAALGSRLAPLVHPPAVVRLD